MKSYNNKIMDSQAHALMDRNDAWNSPKIRPLSQPRSHILDSRSQPPAKSTAPPTKYDLYVRELAFCAGQIASGSNTNEAVQPIVLKYCNNQEFLYSPLALDFIPDVTTYDELKNKHLRTPLEVQAPA